jgi:hypothetical protein
MGSRFLIPGVLGIVLVVILGLGLRPESRDIRADEEAHPAPASEAPQRVASPLQSVQGPKAHPSAGGPVAVSSASPNGISFSRDALLHPDWEKWFNQIASERDAALLELLGSNPESKFIRFAMAVELNDFSSPMTLEQQNELKHQVRQVLKTGQVGLFQGLEKVAVMEAASGGSRSEAAIARALLSESATENTYARMMVEDLFVRESYRDPTQGFDSVAGRFGITPDHPWYTKARSAFNRSPASR